MSSCDRREFTPSLRGRCGAVGEGELRSPGARAMLFISVMGRSVRESASPSQREEKTQSCGGSSSRFSNQLDGRNELRSGERASGRDEIEGGPCAFLPSFLTTHAFTIDTSLKSEPANIRNAQCEATAREGGRGIMQTRTKQRTNERTNKLSRGVVRRKKGYTARTRCDLCNGIQ